METLKIFLMNFLNIVFELIFLLIFIRIVFSWLSPAPNRFTRFIYYATEPILAPFSRFVPKIGFLDISPIVAIFVLRFIFNFLLNLVSLL